MSGCSSWTVSRISPRLVSAYRYSPSPRTPSRSARSLIWRSDSSPDTYRTLAKRQRLSQIWSIRVDFPMPGAPPTSTREPFTAPPPRTRSSSLIPVSNRSSLLASTSRSSRGRFLGTRRPPPPLEAATAAFFLVSAGCSTTVFQAPQAGHWPCHFGISFPHSVQ